MTYVKFFVQGMFATYIPAILEYLSSHTIYHGSYKLPDGRKWEPLNVHFKCS